MDAVPITKKEMADIVNLATNSIIVAIQSLPLAVTSPLEKRIMESTELLLDKIEDSTVRLEDAISEQTRLLIEAFESVLLKCDKCGAIMDITVKPVTEEAYNKDERMSRLWFVCRECDNTVKFLFTTE